MPLNNNYSFRSAGNLYHVTVAIQNAHGGFTPVNAVSDTGNEISIFKREVMDLLGWNPNQGQDFNVAGISGPATRFKKFRLLIKLGTLAPIPIEIGFALKPGDLSDNLLGNKGIVKSGKIQAVYSGDTVTYTQKALKAGVQTGGDHDNEQSVLNNLYENLTTRRKDYEKKAQKKEKTKPDDNYHGHDGYNSLPGYGIFY